MTTYTVIYPDGKISKLGVDNPGFVVGTVVSRLGIKLDSDAQITLRETLAKTGYVNIAGASVQCSATPGVTGSPSSGQDPISKAIGVDLVNNKFMDTVAKFTRPLIMLGGVWVFYQAFF